MTWLRHDDDMLDHPKWIRALRDGGADALLIWWRLCAWSSRRLTDGVIPVDMIGEVARVERSKSKLRALQVLVDVELCTRRDDGALVINDYLERNPSKAEVLEERERRAQAQRNRRLGKPVTGHAPTTHPPPCPSPVPSRPVPSPTLSNESVDARAPELPEVPGLHRVGGVSRVVTMPGPEPTPSYLAECAMAGVRQEQARSTWAHYWTEGLPARGVEKLEPWLVHRAKERQDQLTRLPAKSGLRPVITEHWEPEERAHAYRRKHHISDQDFDRLAAEQRAEDSAGERSIRERHRVFGQRLAQFCRDRDAREARIA